MTAMVLPQFGATTSGGASATAGFIAKQIDQWRRQLQDSYALGQRAKGTFNELYQAFEECRRANWDGYGAVPVSQETFDQAYRFLGALPLGAPAPTVGAEPDGHITFEWYQSPRRTLSISISPESELHYAALLGASKDYGTEPFFGDIPQNILGLVRRVVSV